MKHLRVNNYDMAYIELGSGFASRLCARCAV
jgi:hypothetical protein